MSASFDGNDTLKLGGLEALIKAVKMEPPIARIGILGKTTGRKAAKKNAKNFAKTVKAETGWEVTNKEQKQRVAEGLHGQTNALIGAAHEFGSPANNLPKRSFLREPLNDRLQSELFSVGAFSVAEKKQVIKEKSLVPWLKKVAIIAENIVKGAFDSGGYGKWPKLKKETLARKTTQDILVETTQLRDSITSEVRDRK